MKWFKHDSDAHTDAKLRKLRLKYGMRGYGLYWYCLELIAHNIDEHNLTFELEHDAELIAADTALDSLVVEEMMRYMVTLGLFELSGERISCLKMLKRIDSSMTSNPAMRALLLKAKTSVTNGSMLPRLPNNHDGVMTESCRNHDGVMQEEKRREESNTGDYAADFVTFWASYPNKANKAAAYKAWRKLKPSASLTETILADITSRDWKPPFIPHAGTYLNNRRWEDEGTSVAVGGEVYL